jgi:type I restriction enzyme S subunit
MGEWPTVTLGDVCSKPQYGAITASSEQPIGPLFVRQTDLVDGRIDWSSVPYCALDASAYSKYALDTDDLLVARLGSIGRSARVRDPRGAVYGGYLVRFRAHRERVLPAFLGYQLQSLRWWQYVNAVRSGAVQPTLNAKQMSAYSFPLPPLSEQRAIAEVLGALDDKIEANRRQVQCLLNLIGADWHLRFYESRDQWPELPIGEVCTVVGGSTPRTTVQEYWDGNIAWATPKDLSRLSSPPLFGTERRITELGLRQISSGLLSRGTVLLSSRAPIGYLAIAEHPIAVNQGVIALVPSERLPGLYLWQWLSHNLHEVMNRANGTTFLEVSKTNFRPIPIAVPPEKDLEGWVKIAEPMYRLIIAREIENKELVELRDTLLPKLLSGELRVRDAEPLVEEFV